MTRHDVWRQQSGDACIAPTSDFKRYINIATYDNADENVFLYPHDSLIAEKIRDAEHTRIRTRRVYAAFFWSAVYLFARQDSKRQCLTRTGRFGMGGERPCGFVLYVL